MYSKFFPSILLIILVIDLINGKQAGDLSRRRHVLPPGTSDEASMPQNNQQPGEEDFSADRRPNVNSPALNSNRADAHTPIEDMNEMEEEPPGNRNQNRPRTNVPARNTVAMPGSNSGNVQQPLQNPNPNQAPLNSPMNNNGGMSGSNFGNVQQPLQNPNPNQAPLNSPMNNNGGMSGSNFGNVQQPLQNPNPNLAGNVGVGQSGMGRNLPLSSPSAAANSNQPVGPSAFGGSSWPDFFRRPNSPPNSGAIGSSPMQSPQGNGGQSGQGQESVSELLNKLGNLGGMFGANNQGGNSGIGRR